MEDFGSILWVILVGGAALLSVAKSNSRKRGETKRARRSAEDEQTERQTPPPVPFGMPQNSTPQNCSALHANDSDFAYKALPEEIETSEQSSDQDEEFDLRKAIIYSEILKPKFED